MLTSIKMDGDLPVYKQIENGVQFAIASGRLSSGDRLPPVQKLAAELGINFNTVTKAYRDLSVMGLVTTQRGVGSYVAKGAEARCRAACRKQVGERLHEVVSEARAAGMTKKDIRNVMAFSFESDAGPYDGLPEDVERLARDIIKKKR